MNLGIEEVYKITKRTRKKLILNDKVVNYLFDRMKKENYVYMTSSSSYEEITKDLIKELLKKAEDNDRYWRLECFAIVADYPEYDGVPFEVSHASPYDHRWEGDYDEDAYDDWKIDAVSLEDFMFEDMWNRDPIYISHPEKFDFEKEETIIENEKFEDRNSWW